MPNLGSRVAKRRPEAGPAQRRGRILLAEDERMLRTLLRAVLEKEGHEVVEARDGAEALALTGEALADPPRRPAFDLVVSDVHMPVRTGVDVLRALSERQAAPVMILMTGVPSDELQVQARHLGAFAVLAKPFDLDELREVVDVALIWGEGRKAARRQRQ